MNAGRERIPLTFRPRLVLNHTPCRTRNGIALHRSLHIHWTPIPRIAIRHDRNLDLSYCILDLVAHFLHCNVSRIWQAITTRDGVASQEYHWETGLRDKAGREAIVAAAMRENTVRVCVGFEHHGA